MVNYIKSVNKKYLKLLMTLTIVFIVTGANSQEFSEPVIENEVEDKNITGADVEGAAPNLAFILDLSGSMGRNFGGTQVGNWDSDTSFARCGDQTPDNTDERIDLGFCAENIANLTVCASQNCTEDGHRCRNAVDLQNQEACVLNALGLTSINDTLPNGQTAACIYNRVCGNNNSICGENATFCGDGDERNRAAWALEAAAGFTQCSIASNCQLSGDDDPSCNTSGDINRFITCMNNLQTINDELYSDNSLLPVEQPENCTGGTFLPSPGTTCDGQPINGATRLDSALSVLLNVLDSDDSLDDTGALTCVDSSGLWSNTPGEDISCKDFLETPYRNVSDYIYDGGTITPFPSTDDEAINLPSTPSTSIREQLSDSDADNFKTKFLPMYYSGQNNGDACDPDGAGGTEIDDQSAFGMDTGGFQGGDAEAINRVWDFYRQEGATGGTPLALILGFDDAVNASAGDGSSFVQNDALLAFSNDMPNDPALDCRAEFVIVVTDGDDSCSGDCNDDANSCSGSASASSNANRRSSINAVSKLRTYFSRNPIVSNVTGVGTVKKEVITFVVGLGIDDPNAIRALNAMALAGGTHTTGIIKHNDPATGEQFGTVDINATALNSVLPGSDGDEFEIYRNIAKAVGLDTATPADALLGTCDNPDINGTCTFGGDNVFNNQYLDSGLHTDGATPVDLDGFAFLANTPEELAAAIDTILINIQEFTTSGVAPTAPQSSINVSARDRMFLSILTPIESERLWQGRLALYGFVNSQIPDNPGARTIIKRPTGPLTSETDVANHSIFNSNGNLNDNAKEFFWEAAKNLTEKDLSGTLTAGTRRNLYTTDTLTTSAQNPNVITSDIKDFCCDNCVNPCPGPDPQITPEELGIEDEDVYAETVYPPPACDDVDDIVDCTDDCTEVISTAIDIMDVDAEDCRECIKGCFRDQVVDFMSGNTGILPVEDPMGAPTIEANPASSTGVFGTGCFNEEDGTGSFDTCSIRLGDIFHSTPVLVASPSPLFFDAGFQVFARGFLDRSAALYAGANDGFIHAFHAGEFVDASEEDPETNPFTFEEETVPFFDEGSGIEVFGFAPPTFLFDTLSDNSAEEPFGFSPDFRLGDFKSFVLENNAQRSFFDGSPTISDIWIDAYQNGLGGDNDICPQGGGVSISSPDGNIDLCGREWHTVVTSGLRNGGGAITSLNVTNFKCDASLGDDSCGNAGNGFKKETLGTSFPEHLWTTYDEDFGNTWSQPFIGRVQLRVGTGLNQRIVDRFVYFVGGGLDPTDTEPRDGVNKGNGFYVIDAPTGNILFKFHPDNPSDNTLDNIDDMVCDMAANVLGVDINIDGFTDVVYAGDSCGRMWRFDVSMPLETSSSLSSTGRNGTAVIEAPDWTGGVAFCTGTCLDSSDNVVIPPSNEDLQSVYFAPTVAFDRIGRRHVIFVTGNRRNPSKIVDVDGAGSPIAGTNEFGRLFNFIDNYIPAFLAGGAAVSAPVRTESEFISNNQVIDLIGPTSVTAAGNELFGIQTSAGFDDGLGEFMVEFPDNVTTPTGEKGFGRPLVLGRVLVFTTFAPDSLNTNPCTASFGAGRLFAIDYLTGESALNRIPGAQQSILDGVNDPDLVAGATVAEGLPTTANLAFGTQGSAVLTVAFSGSPGQGGAQFLIWETPQKPAVTQTVFWEEIL